MEKGRGAFLWVLVLAVFVGAVCVVGLRGDFPMIDDWLYGTLVKSLYEEGAFAIGHEISPNMLWQPYWGYLFCWGLGGFSFTALRMSTLVMAAGCMVAFYFILRVEQVIVSKALLGCLALAFSPVFFSLSFTFMTDVPFLALVLGSWFAFAKYFSSGQERYRWLGYALAVGAYGMRLPGILLIPCFDLVLYFSRGRSSKQLLQLTGSVLGAFLVVVLLEEGLKPVLGLRSFFRSAVLVFESRTTELPVDYVFRASRALLGTYGFLGFWLLPFLPWTIGESGIAPRRKLVAVLFGLLVFNLLIILTSQFIYRGFPYITGGNMFYNFGLGPLLLEDVRIWGWPSGLSLPPWTMLVLGCLSQIQVCLLGYVLFKNIRAGAVRNPFLWFVGLFSIAYLLIIGTYTFYDRYLLPPFVAVLIFIFSHYRSSLPRIPTLLIAVAMTWFAIAGTRDYMSWNRAVLAVYDRMLEEGIRPEQIDGGVAMDGFVFHRTGNELAEYYVTFGVRDGVEVVDEEGWYSWVHFKGCRVYVIRLP